MSTSASDRHRSSQLNEPKPEDRGGASAGHLGPRALNQTCFVDLNQLGAADLDDMLAACLERVVGVGPLATPAELRELLPEVNEGVQRFVLLEMIKLDMALHAEAGRVPCLDNYVNALADLIPPNSIPVDLVLEEIQLRKEMGNEPAREEYRRRFPQFDGMIAQLLHGGEATAATRKLRKPPPIPTGTQIDDFAILNKLGDGAFAEVFLAQQISMQRLVALKVSFGTGDEPQALAQFDHPNIVRVFDQRTIREPPVHLLYMQYHPGGTLADVVGAVVDSSKDSIKGTVLLETIDRNLLRAAQAVPDRSSVRLWIASSQWPVTVAWLGAQVSHALYEAHQRGILHRDVKPANVLLTAEGIPKLADFNVSFAGAAGRAGAAATFGGSIGYMSPEHLRAISTHALDSPPPVGKEADLYSLAILLWELWQGRRPFSVDTTASSWSEIVAQQLTSRSFPLVEPKRTGTASERVLERTLRATLQYEAGERPRDAAEMAGRLKLALHPEAASILDPAEDTHRSWWSKRSPWLLAGAVILIPNIVAGFLNFEYNIREITMTDEMRRMLAYIAPRLNSVVYPLGVFLTIFHTKGLVDAVKAARAGNRVAGTRLDDALSLGYRAALIGGTCWIAAGIVYTFILTWLYVEFTSIHATHFLISMVICGGVAMVYPLFGMAIVMTFLYYPMLIRGNMRDERFEIHHRQIIRHCEIFLLVAAIIPLLGAALLIQSQSSSRGFMLTAIAAGVVGLLASFFAYRLIADTWNRFAEVLSNKTSVVPGEANFSDQREK